MHAHGRPERQRAAEEGGRRPADAATGGARAADPPATPPKDLSPDTLLMLQRTVGNDAVARLVADHQVQRSAVREVLRSPGKPLDETTRTEMEARLGADFSDVRLHSDGTARDSAAGIGARAYTSGNHVVLGAGGDDRHTLAHELAHVVQQRSGPVAGTDNGAGLSVSDPADRFEREAEQTANRVMARPLPEPGQAAPARPAPGSPQASVVQRAPAGLPETQHALYDLAGRWKLQSFFALTMGRSNELQHVDTAVAAWRQAANNNPATTHHAQLDAINQAIVAWRAAKPDNGSRSSRAAHINTLAARVAQAMGGQLSDDETTDDGRIGEEATDDQPPGLEPLSSQWRVSANGGMVLEQGESQNFFALPAVINEANAALEQQGSPVRLELSDEDVPAELVPRGLKRVTPVIIAGGRKTGTELLSVHECIDVAKQVTGREMDLAILPPAQPGGEPVTAALNPHDDKGLSAVPYRITEAGMTSGRLLSDLKSNRVLFTWRTHRIELNLDQEPYDGEINTQAINALGPALSQAGMDLQSAQILLRTFASKNMEESPALQQIVVDRLGDQLADPPAQNARQTFNAVAAALGTAAHGPYENNPDLARDRRLGINDAASPGVGEAYAIYSTRARSDDQWNFHFAGVVAKDGDDTVTLENYTRTVKTEEGTKEHEAELKKLEKPAKLWYFDLHGTGGTFHSRYRGSVSGALTLTMAGTRRT
ncbi:DUF4157 domain-containing protein [Actinophytocola sp.]|uniref:eCIS core domain-containing protein n=1 Tax=Actinophytocola sp. TaxID=1872138 RepID=UPI002D606B01|nr:DUF4157 domain-containing protein [Actinophytocola sp.]HYQ68038.1 DUF4157 domain-containing protein [Actinophytocola sp.]